MDTYLLIMNRIFKVPLNDLQAPAQAGKLGRVAQIVASIDPGSGFNEARDEFYRVAHRRTDNVAWNKFGSVALLFSLLTMFGGKDDTVT